MSDDALVMMTPAEVAARDGVSKQAVTKLVRQMVEKHDLPVERDARGRVVRFSLAHYDHHRAQFASSARTNAVRQPDAPAMPDPQGKSRDEALRREAWLKVGREQLRRQEELGQLVRADRLAEGLTAIGREINRLIGRLPNRADDMALAVSREGAHGLRVLLRKIAFEINSEIADALQKVAVAAPDLDPIHEDEEA